jgi:hypothetical protein
VTGGGSVQSGPGYGEIPQRPGDGSGRFPGDPGTGSDGSTGGGTADDGSTT